MRSRIAMVVAVLLLLFGTARAGSAQCYVGSGDGSTGQGWVYYSDENGSLQMDENDDGTWDAIVINAGGATVIENMTDMEDPRSGNVWGSNFHYIELDDEGTTMSTETADAIAYETVAVWMESANAAGCG